MYILTIYCIDYDIEIKLQQASTDENSLKRAALTWAMPYGIVDPETTSDLNEDQGVSYVNKLIG